MGIYPQSMKDGTGFALRDALRAMVKSIAAFYSEAFRSAKRVP